MPSTLATPDVHSKSMLALQVFSSNSFGQMMKKVLQFANTETWGLDCTHRCVCNYSVSSHSVTLGCMSHV